jgi:uncharacterized protein (UPF0332 family)
VTPEADRFLQQAKKHLARGDTMLGVGLNDDAGRAAYLAAFHAAQAVIFEHTGIRPCGPRTRRSKSCYDHSNQ